MGSTFQERWLVPRRPHNYKRVVFENSEVQILRTENQTQIKLVGSLKVTLSNFKTFQWPGNYSKPRKLSTIPIEKERFWKSFVCLWTFAWKARIIFASHSDWNEKWIDYTITPRVGNHGDFSVMRPSGRPNQMFITPRICSVFGATSRYSQINDQKQ